MPLLSGSHPLSLRMPLPVLSGVLEKTVASAPAADSRPLPSMWAGPGNGLGENTIWSPPFPSRCGSMKAPGLGRHPPSTGDQVLVRLSHQAIAGTSSSLHGASSSQANSVSSVSPRTTRRPTNHPGASLLETLVIPSRRPEKRLSPPPHPQSLWHFLAREACPQATGPSVQRPRLSAA